MLQDALVFLRGEVGKLEDDEWMVQLPPHAGEDVFPPPPLASLPIAMDLHDNDAK